MEYEGFLLEKKGSIAVLTLNRPEKLNAITKPMTLSYPRIIEDVRKDDNIIVLIITGAGRGFCAGEDLSQTAEGETDVRRLRLSYFTPPAAILSGSLQALEKPTIAAVNGVAAGGGASLAVACDIVIASENARFGFVQTKIGLIPSSGATFFLPRKVGISKAFELMYTGDVIDAREAEKIGLVSQVVPHDSLMNEATKLAEKLAQNPPIALGLIKRALYRSLNNDLEHQVEFEDFAQRICRQTQDHEEGVKAYLEKRKPVFKGI